MDVLPVFRGNAPVCTYASSVGRVALCDGHSGGQSRGGCAGLGHDGHDAGSQHEDGRGKHFDGGGLEYYSFKVVIVRKEYRRYYCWRYMAFKNESFTQRMRLFFLLFELKLIFGCVIVCCGCKPKVVICAMQELALCKRVWYAKVQ